MIPTVEYVQKKIGEFNSLIFSSCLPPIPVKLTRARTFLGKLQYSRKLTGPGKVMRCTDFLMRISTLFDLSEDVLEDVIIHEMIHYYVAFKGISDTSAHGKVFRQCMEQINRNFGRNVRLCHKSGQVTASPETQPVIRAHYICVSLLQSGDWGITVCAKSRIFELYRTLPKHYQIKQMSWYGSLDLFFNKFPRSTTPKVYRITRQELDEHLASAQEMVCDGRSLRAVRG